MNRDRPDSTSSSAPAADPSPTSATTPDTGPDTFLHPYFLGPAAENADVLESLVVEFLRDHTYWRRNFHPEDGQRISPGAKHDPGFLDFQDRVRAELYRLSADLKRAVPFYHPRYVGHMTGDLLLPGLVAKLVTTLYNPNNVAEEVAPATLERELAVGEQLAAMFGFSCDQTAEPCAWGHLTSGGTAANYEALWNLRSVKFYGLALREGGRLTAFDPDGVGPACKRLLAYTDRELLNLSVDETVELRRDVARALRAERRRDEFHAFAQRVKEERIESLGAAGFFQKHDSVQPPVVLVSASAHYSWEKAMKVMGLGTANLVKVAVDDHMRMDLEHLRECLDEAVSSRTPVLAVVGMLGTTEFGAVDPVHGIVEARRELRREGCDFGIHVDAAWGGYLAAVFRRPDGSFHARTEVAEDFDYFPSTTLYEAFRAIPEVDSVTVDPHKLGYVPYPAGAFVARNREIVDFIAQEAAYVFDLGEEEEAVPRRQKLRRLGQYTLEGSKPGSAAAAVDVTHRVLPLHSQGLGRLLKVTVRTCEVFWDSAREVGEQWRGRVRLVVPFEPDSNLICLALNPADNPDVARANRFARAVFDRMKVDPDRPVQGHAFIGSYTSLTRESLPEGQMDRILSELELDPDTFVAVPTDSTRESDHLFILRHTLMNPWFLDGPGEATYMDRYWAWLGEVVEEVRAEQGYGGRG